MVLFALVFGAFGGFLLFKSFASSVTTFGSFEGGNLSEYADSSCGGNNVSIVTSPVREGRYAGFFQADQNTQCYGDTSMVRLHMLGFPSGTGVNMNSGSTFWRAVSLRIPATNTNSGSFILPEVHQSNDSTGCYGPAPFNLFANSGRWQLVIRGYDDCSSGTFISNIFGAPNSTCDSSTRICHSFVGASDNIQTDQWYDFLLGWHMATDNTGWFEAWMNGPGTGGKSINIVPRTSMPTSYPATNYPMDSIYYNINSSQTKAYYDGGAYSDDFNALTAWQNTFTHSWEGATTDNNTPTITQSIKAGDTLSGIVTWAANTSATNISKIEFAMDSNTNNFTDDTAPFSRTLDTTTLSNGTHNLGLTVTLDDGAVLWEPYQTGEVTVNNIAAQTKPADLNNDGIVNITDLAMLLNKWGTADQTADINQDGIVNIFDLATLLNKWGS